MISNTISRNGISGSIITMNVLNSSHINKHTTFCLPDVQISIPINNKMRPMYIQIIYFNSCLQRYLNIYFDTILYGNFETFWCHDSCEVE
jgi:hypothetical protein